MTGKPRQSKSVDDDTYDAARDAHDSYFVAVEAKRLRGDRHWPEPKKAEGTDSKS